MGSSLLAARLPMPSLLQLVTPSSLLISLLTCNCNFCLCCRETKMKECRLSTTLTEQNLLLEHFLQTQRRDLISTAAAKLLEMLDSKRRNQKLESVAVEVGSLSAVLCCAALSTS